ncbi:MAG: dihydrofolate reductase family protein [Cyanobacteria bacterium J06638_20]
MRKLTYYIATSFDGFVSRTDGSIDDFAFEGEHVADLLSEYPETIPTHLRSYFELANQNRHFDTVLMGRRTYEVGLAAGVTSPYQHLDQYVFSTSMDSSPDAALTLVKANAIDVVRSLKASDGLDIWLCGGPSLAFALLDEIDTIIVKVNPFLMGAGKPLFSSAFPKRDLQLVARRDYRNGFALAQYKLR